MPFHAGSSQLDGAGKNIFYCSTQSSKQYDYKYNIYSSIYACSHLGITFCSSFFSNALGIPPLQNAVGVTLVQQYGLVSPQTCTRESCSAAFQVPVKGTASGRGVGTLEVVVAPRCCSAESTGDWLVDTRCALRAAAATAREEDVANMRGPRMDRYFLHAVDSCAKHPDSMVVDRC